MKIYKYMLPSASTCELVLPQNTKILSFQTQKEILCIWAEVNSGITQYEKRKFVIRGTGSDVPENCKYIGTIQQIHKGINFVWHLYEEILKEKK